MRPAAMAPVLDGRHVRKEPSSVSGCVLRVSRTRRPVMRHALEEVWGVGGGGVDLGRYRCDAQPGRRKGLQAGLSLRRGGLASSVSARPTQLDSLRDTLNTCSGCIAKSQEVLCRYLCVLRRRSSNASHG